MTIISSKGELQSNMKSVIDGSTNQLQIEERTALNFLRCVSVKTVVVKVIFVSSLTVFLFPQVFMPAYSAAFQRGTQALVATQMGGNKKSR